MNDKLIKKSLKSYLTGKKYYDTDKNMAFEYFKQCLTVLNNIKSRDKYSDILNETESECTKYLTMTIESTIEEEVINEKVNNNESLFDIIETGDITKLKNLKISQKMLLEKNDNGLTPLHYAIKCGDTTFIRKLLILGGNIDELNNNGHTLLEYACLQEDPNMINFLTLYGGNMKKHLYFRDKNKQKLLGLMVNKIDIAVIIKYILTNYNIENVIKLDFMFNYINKNDNIGIDNINFSNLVGHIENILNNLSKESSDTYIKIIREELEYNLLNKLGCPDNKLEIILYNILPFLKNFNFNLELHWLLSLEMKYLILKIIKNQKKINIENVKEEIYNKIKNDYIDKNIIMSGKAEILVSQWITRIKI